MATVEMDKVEN